MTSVQVDVSSLRTAAEQLRQAAAEMALAHDQAGGVLDVDVPRLHGVTAADARGMMLEALQACFRLGGSADRLADALAYASEHADQLEVILMEWLTPSHGNRPDAAP